jgi:hypothetical protein
VATIHRLQRSPIPSIGDVPPSQDVTVPRLAPGGWQGDHYAAVLSEVLASIHGMPRPALIRLTARLIDHLDQSDADPDTEDDDPDHEHDGREPDYYL